MSQFYLCHLSKRKKKNSLPKTLSLEVLQSIHLSHDLVNQQTKVQVLDFVPDFEVEDEELGLGRTRCEEKKRSRFLNTKIQHIWVHLQNLIYFLFLDRLNPMSNLLDRLCQCSRQVQEFNLLRKLCIYSSNFVVLQCQKPFIEKLLVYRKKKSFRCQTVKIKNAKCSVLQKKILNYVLVT